MAKPWSLLALAACGALVPSCMVQHDPPSRVFLIREIGLVLGPEPDGSLRGLNLDGRVDDDPATAQCGKVDATDPDGVPGVDNQFSALAGAVVAQLGGSVNSLIQASINDGRLLILVELLGVDDVRDDSDVTARIHLGVGVVDVGTDGFAEPGQSFDLRPDSPTIELRHLRIVDGRIDVYPFDIQVPLSILQASFVLTMLNTRLVLDLQEDGAAAGIFGAGIDKHMIVDIVADDPNLRQALPAVNLLAGRIADLEPDEDGVCQHISAGMTVSATPAFLLDAE